jgi:hypothetical protein
MLTQLIYPSNNAVGQDTNFVAADYPLGGSADGLVLPGRANVNKT